MADAGCLIDRLTHDVLAFVGDAMGADRAYVFHFRGADMPNTHEWVASGTVAPFKDELQTATLATLPYFAGELLRGRPVVLESPADLEPVSDKARLERRELDVEAIEQLALFPVSVAVSLEFASHEPRRATVTQGFIGVDYCTPSRLQTKRDAMASVMAAAGEFVFALQSLAELITGQSPVQRERSAPRWQVAAPSLFHRSTAAVALCRLLQANSLFPVLLARVNGLATLLRGATVPRGVPMLRLADSDHHDPAAADAETQGKPPSSSRSTAWQRLLLNDSQRQARELCATQRYAVLPADVWLEPLRPDTSGHGLEQRAAKDHPQAALLDHFRFCVMDCVDQMKPDIAPYTTFRNVGYARYRYRNGFLHSLKYKEFFQVDPTANVLLSSKPRPFSRLPASVRDHPAVKLIIQVLLERIWSGELGPDVHVNVHPVRVRNFHNGLLHNAAFATLEGTHTDSTNRVAVILIDRHNVCPGPAVTALYRSECPMGKRRNEAKDEAEIGPLRVAEVQLETPFEAITFDDTCFKHDASDPVAADPSRPMSRCVLLVMARVPCSQASPVDERPVDGYTPRSAREAVKL